jgi:hypothetical protein
MLVSLEPETQRAQRKKGGPQRKANHRDANVPIEASPEIPRSISLAFGFLCGPPFFLCVLCVSGFNPIEEMKHDRR